MRCFVRSGGGGAGRVWRDERDGEKRQSFCARDSVAGFHIFSRARVFLGAGWAVALRGRAIPGQTAERQIELN